jgi:hypothetical protein
MYHNLLSNKRSVACSVVQKSWVSMYCRSLPFSSKRSLIVYGGPATVIKSTLLQPSCQRARCRTRYEMHYTVAYLAAQRSVNDPRRSSIV